MMLKRWCSKKLMFKKVMLKNVNSELGIELMQIFLESAFAHNFDGMQLGKINIIIISIFLSLKSHQKHKGTEKYFY